MNVSPRKPLFNRRPQSNIYRMFVYIVMLLGAVWILQQVNRGDIQPLFKPTPIPTRTFTSYIEEAEANAKAGNLNAAILAYKEALKLNPNDAQTWAELARTNDCGKALPIAQTLQSRFPAEDETNAVILEAADSIIQICQENLDNPVTPTLESTAQPEATDTPEPTATPEVTPTP